MNKIDHHSEQFKILTEGLFFNQLQRMVLLKSAQERMRRSGRSEAVKVC